MYFVTVLKESKVVVDCRLDQSEPPYWTAHSLRNTVSVNTKLSEDTLDTYALLSAPKHTSPNFTGLLTPYMHVFDNVSETFSDNPSYVPPPVERRLGISEVFPHLTLQEKTKFINKLTPTVVTAIQELSRPRNVVDTTEILQFLVDSGDISQASMNKILS